jgi:hypothetical protein
MDHQPAQHPITITLISYDCIAALADSVPGIGQIIRLQRGASRRNHGPDREEMHLSSIFHRTKIVFKLSNLP